MAEVLGLPVHATSVEQMRQLVLGELSGRYAAERGLFVSETELEAYLSEQWRAANGPFRPMEHETTIERNAREKAARSLLRQRRIDGALYRQYGGRVALVDGVPVPIDAYRRFLEEQAVQGRFRILFPSLEVEFWSAFADDPRREYLPDGSEAAARAFEMPVPAPRVN